MLVTSALAASASGGRAMLGRLNHRILRELFAERLTVVELERPVRRTGLALAGAGRGHIDGLDGVVIQSVLDRIERDGINLVFLDGSNLGALAKAIKQSAPGVTVCTFCHNVEASFFWGALKRRRSLRALAVLAVNCLAERKAVRHSDVIIALSARDSDGLKRLYGRGATHVSAIAVEEPAAALEVAQPVDRPKYALFVGGIYYANRAGIAWFAKHVSPRIGLRTIVVGHGFETFRTDLETSGAVEVIGGVDDLSSWYRGAHVVVAPIFDGSGMKTKVAEALMFGKRIIATPEAFSGYEAVAADAGWRCATADEFVAAITEAEALDLPDFDPVLRALYDEHFSYGAARDRLARILSPATIEGSDL